MVGGGVRVRDEDRGDAQHGQLGDRRRSGPSDDHVGRRVGVGHVVEEREHPHPGVRALRIDTGGAPTVERCLVAAVSGDMEDLHPQRLPCGRCIGDAVVDAACALAATERQQRRTSRRETESLSAGTAPRDDIEVAQTLLDGVSGDVRARTAAHADVVDARRVGHGDPVCEAPGDAVREPGTTVLLVEHERDPATCCERYGQGDVASEGHDHAHGLVAEQSPGGPDRTQQARCDAQERRRGSTRERDRPDRMEVVTRDGHEALLQAVGQPSEAEAQVGTHPPERLCGRYRRQHVACGPATHQQDVRRHVIAPSPRPGAARR